MAVGVAKVETPASQFPLFLFFHGDCFTLKPRLPTGQFGGRDGEGEMQFAVAVMRGLGCARSSLLEQQQHLARAGVHGATTLAEVGYDAEAKCLLIEANG